jgi:hypothetical protein
MRSFGLVSVLAILILPVLGCGKETRQSFDGIYCSHEDEDPMYVCSKAYDLVCIATDRHINPMTGALGNERYLCRLSCMPGQSCPEGVCCKGKVYGNNRGSDYACVPTSFCEDLPDASPRDTRPATDAGSDASDGGASDGGGDGGGDSSADSAPDAGDASDADAPVDAPDDSTAG